jgi:hypothetical protein
MSKSTVGRRAFLEQVAGLGALASCGLSAQTAVPRPPTGVVVGSPTRGLLSPGDMSYKGMWRASPLSGASDANLSYSRGPIAFRRVGGELRLLVVGRLPMGTSTDPAPGPLMEFRMPSSFGAVADASPEMSLVRKWEGSWASGFYTDMNGVNIGGMWYDHDWDVLWYTIYATYGGPNDPP